MPRAFFALFVMIVMAVPASAGSGTYRHETGEVPAYVAKMVPGAKLVGQGRYRYVFWDIYDASLYAPQGEYKPGKPFALQLHYLRHISGRDIADTSVAEIRKQGFSDEVKLATWHTQMRQVFPNVTSGSNLTGIALANGQTVIFLDDQKIGAFNDREFTKRFFAIWLDPMTSVPALRQSLLRVAHE